MRYEPNFYAGIWWCSSKDGAILTRHYKVSTVRSVAEKECRRRNEEKESQEAVAGPEDIEALRKYLKRDRSKNVQWEDWASKEKTLSH